MGYHLSPSNDEGPWHFLIIRSYNVILAPIDDDFIKLLLSINLHVVKITFCSRSSRLKTSQSLGERKHQVDFVGISVTSFFEQTQTMKFPILKIKSGDGWYQKTSILAQKVKDLMHFSPSYPVFCKSVKM